MQTRACVNGIQVERSAGGLGVEGDGPSNGVLEAEVICELARRRRELFVLCDRLTLEVLAERANTRRDLYISLDLPGTHAGKAEAVRELIALEQVCRTHEYWRRARLLSPAPIVDRLRNLRRGKVQRPHTIVRRGIAVSVHVAALDVRKPKALSSGAGALGRREMPWTCGL